jgi:hypothetical protein
MTRQTNPFNNFLFSIPGKRGKYTYKEMRVLPNIKKQEVEIIDLVQRKSLGRMSALAAILKFE